MQANLDGDIVSYRCAATAEKDGLDAALYRTNDLVRRIIQDVNATSHLIFLGGSSNFRYDIYPGYKAQRVGKAKPTYLENVREYLVKEWNAIIADGQEADDLLGINQSENTVCCSIDKDLLQIPGMHYNFVKNEFYTINKYNGLVNFYKQLIVGDATDNIPGYDGKIRTSTPQFIANMQNKLFDFEEEEDMFKFVYDLYEEIYGEQTLTFLNRNGQCLYIRRKEGDQWQMPNLGQKDEEKLS